MSLPLTQFDNVKQTIAILKLYGYDIPAEIYDLQCDLMAEELDLKDWCYGPNKDQQRLAKLIAED